MDSLSLMIKYYITGCSSVGDFTTLFPRDADTSNGSMVIDLLQQQQR